MIPLAIIFSLYIACSMYVIHALVANAREERKDLEDRLMAITQPVALVTKQALEAPEPAEIAYVDEQREWELNGKTVLDTLGEED